MIQQETTTAPRRPSRSQAVPTPARGRFAGRGTALALRPCNPAPPLCTALSAQAAMRRAGALLALCALIWSTTGRPSRGKGGCPLGCFVSGLWGPGRSPWRGLEIARPGRARTFQLRCPKHVAGFPAPGACLSGGGGRDASCVFRLRRPRTDTVRPREVLGWPLHGDLAPGCP